MLQVAGGDTMTNSDEMTLWIEKLKAGDSAAAEAIWRGYIESLLRLVRHRMSSLPRRVSDEDDVALSALHSFFRGAAAGRFPALDDREDLWKLLVVIAARKVSAQRRRLHAQRRGEGLVRGESIFYSPDDASSGRGIDSLPNAQPTPEFVLAVAEDCEALLARLKHPRLRDIAVWKMEGYSNAEIGQKLQVTERTVERRLKQIRDTWLVD
jgi:DNA-directed RNA polymerase specialized sigma24 family protein